jgi:hypothetical protein
METLSVILSMICRVALVGIAVPLLLGNFPGYTMPSRMTTDWAALAACDAFAVIAPLIRWRKASLLAGMLGLGVHYGYRHHAPVLGLAYMGVAIVLALLPKADRRKPTGFAANTRGVPTGRR